MSFQNVFRVTTVLGYSRIQLCRTTKVQLTGLTLRPVTIVRALPDTVKWAGPHGAVTSAVSVGETLSHNS